MKRLHNRRTMSRRGFAYVLALILLTLFTTLSMAFVAETNLNLQKSENTRSAMGARLAAESGLSFAVNVLKDLQSEGCWEGQPDMLQVAYEHLAGKLDDTPNTHGVPVTHCSGAVFTPQISLGEGAGSFSFIITKIDDSPLRLLVTGFSGSYRRQLAVDLHVNEDERVLYYSVASRSRVIITDNAVVDGDICSTWDRTRIGSYDIPPFLMESGTRVNGKVKTILSKSEFDEYDSGDYIEGEHDGIVYDEPEFAQYTTDDFDTSNYKVGTVDITTLDPPDYWLTADPFPDVSNIRRRIDRPVYENRTFDNIYIPTGYNPKFINCTFKRIIYIDTDETKTLDEWSHNYYHEHAIPGREYYSDDPDNEYSNNVIFENCTFEGPIITAVPRDYWWSKNALTFEGTTTFTNIYMPESTILAPNFGVDIGGRGYDDEENPDSKLTGIIVGGIVDVRGTADIEGTILSMYYPDTDRGTAARYYGTNIGYYNDGGEAGDSGIPGNIRIVPHPEYQLPFGIRKRYTLTVVPGSYEEVK